MIEEHQKLAHQNFFHKNRTTVDEVTVCFVFQKVNSLTLSCPFIDLVYFRFLSKYHQTLAKGHAFNIINQNNTKYWI